MAIKAVSQLPDPIQPLADTDLLFLTQYDADSEQFVSVQLPLGQLKDYVNGVTPEPISCEGATPLIHFPPFFGGNWDLYIDDVLVAEDADPGDLYTAISTGYASVLFVDQDSYFRIENISSQPHRFKLVPKMGASHEPPEASTPAYFENGDGSLDFCLAAAE